MLDHPRVLNVMRDRARILELAEQPWLLADGERPLYVYAGRGRCPVTRRFSDWGNPFTIEAYGADAMRRFIDDLALQPKRIKSAAETFAEPTAAGCWCAGRYPVCHAEVYVRLGDGEPLEKIRTDILHRLDVHARQRDLFPEAQR